MMPPGWAWIDAQAGLAAAVFQRSTGAVMAGDVVEAVPDVIADSGHSGNTNPGL